MSEAELIQGLKRGEYSSYETLFKMHYARFVNFVATLISDREAAKDLVQEAFMKVWVNREKLDESLSIGNYLYVLVKRATFNFIRDRKFAESLTEELLNSESRTDNSIDARDAIRRIEDGVERLPAKRREVFLMSRKEGLSNKEIAEELSLSVKTVERHITLALSDLRKNLDS